MMQTKTHNEIINERINHAFCDDGETLYITIFETGGGTKTRQADRKTRVSDALFAGQINACRAFHLCRADYTPE